MLFYLVVRNKLLLLLLLDVASVVCGVVLSCLN
jgi:hypothetical protein